MEINPSVTTLRLCTNISSSPIPGQTVRSHLPALLGLSVVLWPALVKCKQPGRRCETEWTLCCVLSQSPVMVEVFVEMNPEPGSLVDHCYEQSPLGIYL